MKQTAVTEGGVKVEGSTGLQKDFLCQGLKEHILCLQELLRKGEPSEWSGDDYIWESLRILRADLKDLMQHVSH